VGRHIHSPVQTTSVEPNSHKPFHFHGGWLQRIAFCMLCGFITSVV